MQPPIVIVPDDGCLPQAEPMGKKKKECTDVERSRVMRQMAKERADKLTAERRSEIARNAARARWGQKKSSPKPGF